MLGVDFLSGGGANWPRWDALSARRQKGDKGARSTCRSLD